MSNSLVSNGFEFVKLGNSLSYIVYGREITCPILTPQEVEIFRVAFQKHSYDRASRQVHPSWNCTGLLADRFAQATLNQVSLKPKMIDPSLYCKFSDEEAVSLAAKLPSKEQVKASFDALRSKTLKEFKRFYWGYLNNIDKEILENQKSPIDSYGFFYQEQSG